MFLERSVSTWVHRVIVGVAIAGSSLSFGEETRSTSSRTSDLGEIVVTATRYPRKRDEVPTHVTVIDRSQVSQTAARNLDDVLRSVPGVSLLQTTGMGYGLPAQVNMRGVPGHHGVLVLIDGMPLNEARGGFLNINEIPLSEIQQVEIVRGAFSSLYGSDAFSGVINIRTQDPVGGPQVEMGVGAGNEDYTHGYVSARVGDASLGYTLTYDTRHIDNYLAQDQVIQRFWDSTIQDYLEVPKLAENYDYSDQRVLCKLNMNIGAHSRLVLQGRYFDSELGYGQKDFRPLYPQAEDDVISTCTAMLGARWVAAGAKNQTGFLQGHYRWQTRDVLGLDFSHQTGSTPVFVRSLSDTESQDWKMEGGVRLCARKNHVFSLGVDFFGNQVDFSPLRSEQTGVDLPLSSGKNVRVHNLGAYVQDEYRLGPSVRVVGGLRLDDHSDFDNVLSPRVGIQYDGAEETVLRASAGQAYRAPTPVELYQPTLIFGSSTFESNPDLKPEYITTVDAGLERALFDGLSMHVDVFYNGMKNLITTAVVGSTLTQVNADKAWSSGVEAGLNWHLLPGWSAYLNYTFQMSEDADTGESLSLIPENLLNAGVRFRRKLRRNIIEFSVGENYVGQRGYADLQTGRWRVLDGYWRTDLSARVTVAENSWFAVSVLNATDEEYQEWELINPAPGRLYAIEMGVRYW